MFQEMCAFLVFYYHDCVICAVLMNSEEMNCTIIISNQIGFGI